MPNPKGSPLESCSLKPIIGEDGKPALKVTYAYEDGDKFTTEYKAWALVGVEDCRVLDTHPPREFNPETETFDYAW